MSKKKSCSKCYSYFDEAHQTQCFLTFLEMWFFPIKNCTGVGCRPIDISHLCSQVEEKKIQHNCPPNNNLLIK